MWNRKRGEKREKERLKSSVAPAESESAFTRSRVLEKWWLRTQPRCWKLYKLTTVDGTDDTMLNEVSFCTNK